MKIIKLTHHNPIHLRVIGHRVVLFRVCLPKVVAARMEAGSDKSRALVARC